MLTHVRFLAPLLGRPCLIPRHHARVQIQLLREPSSISAEVANLSASKAVEFTTHLA